MLGRTHRFHGYNSLRGVYRRGRMVRGPLMSLRFIEHGSSNKPYRAAVVVSRKVNKSAVVRNRIRRRVYGTLQEEASGNSTLVRPGTDLIFTAFSDRLADMPANELRKAVKELLEKTEQAKPL